MSFGNSALQDSETKNWRPNMAFFRRQRATVTLSGTAPSAASWRFQSISDGRLPFHFLRCELTVDGTTAIGQGYHGLLKISMRQALAEAWERLWLTRPQKADQGENAIDYPNSNGFAAGATASGAKESSRAELIERAMVLTAWRSMRGWHPYTTSSLFAKLLCSGLRANNWRIRLFELRDTNLGSVVVALAESQRRGAIFDSVFVGHARDRRHFEAKLLRSITRVTLFNRSKFHENSGSFPDRGSPQDQASFYAKPVNLTAFKFLDGVYSTSGGTNLANPDDIKTTLLCGVSEMPAVAVSHHVLWPRLTWGKESIEGENPWPHPLA